MLDKGYFPLMSNRLITQASAALTMELELTPRVFHDRLDMPEPIQHKRETLNHIRDILLLISNSQITTLGYWIELNDSVPCKEWLGYSWSQKDNDILPRANIKLTSNEWSDFSELAECYLNLDNSVRSYLSRCIYRLGLSRKRKDPIDRAIEIGIGFEMLMTHGDRGNHGITQRLKTRTSKMLGRSDLEQEKIYFLTGKFYKIRCDAVHNGFLESTYNCDRDTSKSPEEILSIGEDYMIKIIKLIIRRGQLPNW